MSIRRAACFVLCWSLTLVIGSYVLLLTTFEVFDGQVDASAAVAGERLSAMSVDNMSAREIMAYIRWPNSSACTLNRDLGNGADGRKSVCLDRAVRPEPGNCVAYSFGVGHDFAVDDALAAHGCKVYAFDPTIARDYERSANVRVYKFNLGYKSDVSVHGWNVTSLVKTHRLLRPSHGSDVIDYLRFDTEDSDLRVLPNIVRTGMLKAVRQLAVEVHVVPEGTTDELRDLVELLQSLERAGMVRYASNPIPSSRDWLEAIEYDGELDYEINWYNSELMRRVE